MRKKIYAKGIALGLVILLASTTLISAGNITLKSRSHQRNVTSSDTSTTTGPLGNQLFCGIVRNLDENGNNIECTALLFAATELLLESPKTIMLYFDGEQLTIVNLLVLKHKDMPLNLKFIFGTCETIERM
jgi:hypothetical protein